MAWTKAKTAAATAAGILLTAGAITIVLNQAASKPASGAQSVDARVLWAVGKTYSLRLSETQDVETHMPGQPRPTKQSFALTIDYHVSVIRELANGGRELELSFGDQQLDITLANGVTTHFDSRSDSGQAIANPIIPMLRKLSGFRIKYATDAAGAVEKVEGADALLREAATTIKQRDYQDAFRQLFGGDILKNYVGFGEMTPGRAVTTGDRWSKTSDFASPAGPMTTDSEYVFKGMETQDDHRCMRIVQTARRFSPKADATAQRAPLTVKKNEAAGNIWFDPELGMIRDYDYGQNMTLEIPAGGRAMTLQVKLKIKIALLDVN